MGAVARGQRYELVDNDMWPHLKPCRGSSAEKLEPRAGMGQSWGWRRVTKWVTVKVGRR